MISQLGNARDLSIEIFMHLKLPFCAAGKCVASLNAREDCPA
jgi:hypothetical protein